MEPTVKIFSAMARPTLQKKLQKLGRPIGDLKIQKFSDGEFQPVYNESIREIMYF